MSSFSNPKKVMIPCRFSFLHCWEPDSVNGSEPKYSVSAIIPKSDTKTVSAIKAAIEVAKQESLPKWGGKIPPNLKLPLRDGDIDRPEDEAYAGCYFLNANSREKPQVVDKQVQPISAYKLATMIKDSDELLHDSVFDVASYIAREFARRIGAAEEEAFFTGNGTGKPTGLLHTTGGAEVGVTAKSTTALTFDEVMDLFYSLRAPYRRSAVFLTNDATMKALRQLKNGNGDYIWQPSVTAGTPDTILNRPVYTSTFMPTIAAGAKAMVFGDMNYYWIADREGRKFQRLNELYAPTGQVGFLASQRVDGKLILPEAVKVLQMKAA